MMRDTPPANPAEFVSETEHPKNPGLPAHLRAAQACLALELDTAAAGTVIVIAGADRRHLSQVLDTAHHALEKSGATQNMDEEHLPDSILRVDALNPALHQSPLVDTLADMGGAGVPKEVITIDGADLLSNWVEQVKQVQAQRPNCVVCLTTGTFRQIQENWRMIRVSSKLFIDYCQDRQLEPPLAMATDRGWEHAVSSYNQLFLGYLNDEEGIQPLDLLYDPGMSDHGVARPRDLATLFILLAKETGQEQTIEDLAHRTAFAKNTVRKYLEYLEDRMLIHRQYRIGPHGQRLRKQKVFRAHINHAGLRAALLSPTRSDILPADTALASYALTQWGHMPFAGDIHYRHGNEAQPSIDLVALGGPGTTPLLAGCVSWQGSSGTMDALETMMQDLGIARGVHLSRDSTDQKVLETGRISQLPLSFYLYFLGLNIRRSEATGKAIAMSDIFEIS